MGRLDASAFTPPYTCEQAAHKSADCRRFFVRTGKGTAQLCEWHTKCVEATVVDCAGPPPPSPPLGPQPPPPFFALAHASSDSKLEAAKSLAKKVTGVVVGIHHSSADEVVRRTGVEQWQAEALVAVVVIAIVAMVMYAACFLPIRNRCLRQKREQIETALASVAGSSGGRRGKKKGGSKSYRSRKEEEYDRQDGYARTMDYDDVDMDNDEYDYEYDGAADAEHTTF